MLAHVEQDVGDRVPDLAGRLQAAQVVAVREDAAAHAEDTLDGAFEASAERDHASRERNRIISLNDEVRMVALYGEVNHSKASAIADLPE